MQFVYAIYIELLEVLSGLFSKKSGINLSYNWKIRMNDGIFLSVGAELYAVNRTIYVNIGDLILKVIR